MTDVLAMYGIRNNAKFTPVQKDALAEVFKKTQYPTHEEKLHLSQTLKLSEVQISNWFHHRRKKTKKQLHWTYKCFLQELLLNNFGKPKFSEQQQAVLDTYFALTKYPTAEQKQRILVETGLSMLQVNKWFDNKRNRDKNSAKNSKKSGPRIIVEHRRPLFDAMPKFIITDKDFAWFIFQSLLESFGIKSFQRYTQEQTRFLEEIYLVRPYPSKDEKVSLSKRCSLNLDQITNWFLNRRRKDKNKSN